MPEAKQMAPGATEATADQTTAKSPNPDQCTAVPNTDTVFAVVWRRADPRTGRVKPVTAYRPTLERAERVAARAAKVAVDGPPVIFAAAVEWAVTS